MSTEFITLEQARELYPEPDREPLSDGEVAMLNAIHDFMCKGTGRSPKAWEVGGAIKGSPRYWWQTSPSQKAKRKAFRHLVANGYVTHSRNGHCWLTEKGQTARMNPPTPETAP